MNSTLPPPPPPPPSPLTYGEKPTTEIPVVIFQKLHPDAQIPKIQTTGAAGMDLSTVERFTIEPGGYHLVDTGLAMQLPTGYEAQIRPRSGLAAKHGITVLNSPGTIDSDYRGPVKVILINHGTEPQMFMCPDRIAQMVIAKVSSPLCVEAAVLSDTERAAAGFGSTGK